MTNFGDIYSISMSFVTFPLSNIFLSLVVLPKPIALHRAIIKITHIKLVSEFEISLTMGSIVLKIPKIDGAVGELHIAFTNLKVKTELAFIDCIWGEFDADSMLHSSIGASKIETIIIVENGKVRMIK